MKKLTTDNINIDDIKKWARSSANGTATDDSLIVEDEDGNDVDVVGLKWSPESGGGVYFAWHEGILECPMDVREWLESDDAGEFAGNL